MTATIPRNLCIHLILWRFHTHIQQVLVFFTPGLSLSYSPSVSRWNASSSLFPWLWNSNFLFSDQWSTTNAFQGLSLTPIVAGSLGPCLQWPLSMDCYVGWENPGKMTSQAALCWQWVSAALLSQQSFINPQPTVHAICPLYELPSRHLAVQEHDVWLRFRGTYLYISHTYFLRTSFLKTFLFIFFKPSCGFSKSFYAAFFITITINLALKAGSISLLWNKYRMPWSFLCQIS